MSEQSEEFEPNAQPEQGRIGKPKPIKILPTARLGFEKQLSVLRGYSAAAGAERRAVSNAEVGAIVQIHENTVSVCNPFFSDIGFLVKEGMKNRPSDEVADYAQAYEWDGEKAAIKLAPTLRKCWFSIALIPKLTFRPLSKDEAVSFLAAEAKASKDYKGQLEDLVEYLKVAGIINFDGSTLTLGPNARDAVENLGAGMGKPQNPIDQGQQNNQVNPVIPQQPTLPAMEPLIRGLIEKLPPSGNKWALKDRAKWLMAAAMNFDLMYESEDDNEGVSVSLEGKTLSIKQGGAS